MGKLRRSWTGDDGGGPPAHGPIDKKKRDEVLKHCEKLPRGFEKKCFRCRPKRGRSCEDLLKNIENLKKEIEKRFKEQEQGFSDWNDPKGHYRGYCPPGTANYINHTTKIENAQVMLKQRVDDYENHKDRCDKTKLPRHTKQQIEKKVAYRDRWRPNPFRGFGTYVKGSGRE